MSDRTNETRTGWLIERNSSSPVWLKGTELNLRDESAWTDNPNNVVAFASENDALVLLMTLLRHTRKLGFRPRIEEFKITGHEWL